MKTETQKRLDEDIPKDAIDTRSHAGVTLSYLSGAYVINRLNQVYGNGNWSSEIRLLEKVYEGTLKNSKGEDTFNVSYRAIVKLTIPDKELRIMTVQEGSGYGDGLDKRNPGKAHELAIKEAETDALKRAAKNLGISMGIGLYFKGGDYEVDQNEAKTEEVPVSVPVKTKVDVPKAEPKAKKEPTIKRTRLREYTRTLVSLKKVTPDEIVKTYLNGKSKEQITEEMAESAVAQILIDYKEVFEGGPNA